MTSQLIAYADESGVHQKPGYTIVSGFIGSPNQWKKFERGWLEVITRHSVPDFHAKIFFQRDKEQQRLGPYKGWTDEKADAFLSELLGLVKQRRLYPIGAFVDVEVFNKLPEGERRFLTGAALSQSGRFKGNTGSTRPYHLAFHLFLIEAAKRAEDRVVVHFMFDHQTQVADHAIRTFRQTASHGDRHPLWKKLGDIAYVSRTQALGLQLADLHAYAWYSFATKGGRIGPELRKAMDVLTLRNKSIGIWEQEHTDRLLANLSQKQLAGLRKVMQ